MMMMMMMTAAINPHLTVASVRRMNTWSGVRHEDLWIISPPRQNGLLPVGGKKQNKTKVSEREKGNPERTDNDCTWNPAAHPLSCPRLCEHPAPPPETRLLQETTGVTVSLRFACALMHQQDRCLPPNTSVQFFRLFRLTWAVSLCV